MSKTEYTPFRDPEFMSEKMLSYFQAKLLKKRQALLNRLEAPSNPFQEASDEKEDLARFTLDNELSLKTSARSRLSSYLQQIDLALQRIEDNSYGFCAKTKCPISLRRLEIQPTALYSIEAQEEIEKQEEYEQLRQNLQHQ